MKSVLKQSQSAWLVLCAVCMFGLAQSVQAASFDCAKAQSKVEKMICANDGLSKLDEEMAERYKEAMTVQSQLDELRQKQKQWIKARNACSDEKCLRDSYTQRLLVLRSPALAPFQFFRNEELPEQRTTSVCKDFKNYLNHPRSNELFNPDGTLIRESSLFKSVRWEALDKAKYRTVFIAYLEVTRPGELRVSDGTNNSVAHQLLRRYDDSQWVLQRALAYPFEFNPKPEQKQRWLFRLVNLQPYTRNMKDPQSKVELPTWFSFGDEAFLGYEDGSQLERNTHDLVRTSTRQWVTYAGNTYAVINATYGDGKGATPAFLSVEVDQLNVEDTGASFMHFTCAFRAKNNQ